MGHWEICSQPPDSDWRACLSLDFSSFVLFEAGCSDSRLFYWESLTLTLDKHELAWLHWKINVDKHSWKCQDLSSVLPLLTRVWPPTSTAFYRAHCFISTDVVGRIPTRGKTNTPDVVSDILTTRKKCCISQSTCQIYLNALQMFSQS